jgi:hypothetical protein
MRTIKKLLSFFWSLQKFRVRENLKFKDLHKGQTCLIFGNGASLKYYDFNAIPDDLIAITCTFSLVDKRLKKKNVKYNIFSEPYIMYPMVFNDYTHKVQKNPMRKIFRKLISENKQVNFFSSITNSLGYFLKPSNVHYWHHFGLKDFSSNDLAGKFSTCSTALDNMIGLSRYLGFSKALILGCDYMCNPKMEGHFYADKIPVFGKEDLESQKRIRKSVRDLDVLVICPKGVSSNEFPSISFEEYFKAEEYYQTNKEIIDIDNLKLMQDIADAKLIFL